MGKYPAPQQIVEISAFFDKITMDNNNPIKYSDLIAPDNAIELLVKQLTEAREAYKGMAQDIRTEAEKLREVLKGMPSGLPDPKKIPPVTREVDRLAQAQKRLAFERSEDGKKLAELNRKIQEAKQINKYQVQYANSVAGSYNRLSALYSLLKIKINQMSEAENKNVEAMKKLQDQANKVYTEMNRLQVATGKHTLNVGNYASAFNGLGMATQQLVRELPSLAISANTFFLAISNNIPILVDQINMMRAANKAALAEGKPTTSILKGIVGSLLSWQTALVIGITLLSQHGGKVIEWVKQLFNGKEALDITAEAAKNFNKTMQQGAVDAVSETTKLDLLYNAATNSALSMERRRAAAEELQRMYPDYLGNMTTEQIMLGQAVEKYQELTTAIIKYAEAKAAENQIIENATKMQKISNIADIESLRTLRELEKELNAMGERYQTTGKLDENRYKEVHNAISKYGDSYHKLSKQIAKDLELETNDIVTFYDTLNATNSKLAEIAQQGIGANPSGAGTTKTTTKDAAKDAEDQYKRLVKARRDYEDKELESEQDKWVKRRKQTQYEYDREIEDLRHALETQTDLTAEEREIMNATIVLLQQQREDELVKIGKEQNVAELEAQEKGINDQLKAEQKGSDRYFQLQLKKNRIALSLALARNKLLAQAEQQSADEIEAIYNKLFADITNEWAETQDKNAEDAEKKAQEAQKKEIDRIRSIFQTAQQTIAEYSKNSSDAIDAFRKIFNTAFLKGVDENGNETSITLGQKLGDMFGLDDKGLQNLEKGMESAAMIGGTIIGIIQDVAAARVEAADKAVEASRREIDAARDALQAELTARNEGYAHNVAQARKELELARRTEKQALAEKQRAQRQQLAMDSISQASNLVTASALVWSQLGFPWAIAAIGSMFASFAATKIMAARASRETYGDGTVELLHGGSHQSGNDIDLGTKPDGTRRRAEGGEYFAVFNKRASRNRGALITDVVNSLNNGTFAQKYQRAYDMGGGIMLNVGGSSPDLRRLSDDVRKIKEQNERRTYLDGEGNEVEVYKNVKRVIKKC